MILELSTADKLSALSVHRAYLEIEIARVWQEEGAAEDLKEELSLTTQLMEQVIRITRNPKDHLVVVTKSRKVEEGSVGRVVYADPARNHARVEFGLGDKVSLSLANIEVIDLAPLPDFIPAPGCRVHLKGYPGCRVQGYDNAQFIAINWRVSNVLVVNVLDRLDSNQNFTVARNQIEKILP